jgi:hypothetical protein
MAQDNARPSPSGRSALGGAAGGFTYDGAMQDVMAREDQLRRPLRLKRWHDDQRPRQGVEARREALEPEHAGPSP